MKSWKMDSGQSGISLIELVFAIAIVAIITALAVPSFKSMITNLRARGAADELYADMYFTKAEAIKRNKSVRVIISGGSAWSYCISTSANCASGVLKTVSQSDFPDTTLTSSQTLPLSISISPRRGTTSQAATITYSAGSSSAKVIISSIGRIRRQ